jgi:hypothetical protein
MEDDEDFEMEMPSEKTNVFSLTLEEINKAGMFMWS